MIDVRTIDGQIVKLNTHEPGETSSKTLDLVSNLYKVNMNMEDINQLICHDIFGKLQQPANSLSLTSNGEQSQHNSSTVAILHNAGMVVKSCEQLNSDGTSSTVLSTDLSMSNNSNSTSPSPGLVPTGTHTCDICGKIFPFRYQMIVHRRYHAEKKPFTCQVRTCSSFKFFMFFFFLVSFFGIKKHIFP